ncbi:MAG: DUF559 domain-containing protein [Armatimonadetes bacterium]|nr:DUF559 domain-containing protein [Armatimonadota bacterium]
MNTTCIKIEGGLLAPDFLEAIADAEGQKAADFGIEGRRTLVDEVSSLWSDVRSYWDAFQRRLQRQSSESLTTITREQWMIPLLEALGYRLTYHPQGVEIEGRNYRISHRTGATEDDLPIHIEPFDQDLGSRPPSGRSGMAPHAMLQDYLNRTEHLWGIVTNGSTLRLLRDSSYFTRPSYIEFDLRQMLEGERLDEFFLFYRLVHRTRLPRNAEDGPNCLLEKYHQLGIEQGGRIRDGLRNAVEQAIVTFANGFLAHPRNEQLREDLRSGSISATDFYQQLLYLIYRLLFLMVAEERGLLSGGDGGHHSAREYFTVQRLRALADEPLSAPERFSDLYLNLRALFYSLCNEEFAAALGLPPLNGELFDCARTSALSDAYLNNRDLLTAMHTLSWFVPRDQRVPTRVNYRHLDVEELGSVYESLLDLQPIVEEHGGRLNFRFGSGTERKTTGSYYTRPELVQELIKSALVPVIEDRLASPPAPSPQCGEGMPRGSGAGVRPKVEPVPGYVYDLARKLRKEGTDSENLLWQCLRDRQLAGHKFHRQHPLGRYIADFYCAEARLVVELDGAPHREQRQAEYDQLRDEEIAKRGLTVLRIQSADVQRDPQSVLNTIARHLTPSSPSSPSPPSGEGAGGEVDPREAALLGLKVCDPACGSGHFLLAAARRIGTELAKVRTGEEAPAPDAVREAVRDVITHCIYGVDKNPLAVDLCKVALWIEGHSGGKPLTFLDHRIRCGDSLVGVFDLKVLEEGIPDAAFDPVSGDDRKLASAIKKRNKKERTGQHGFAFDTAAEVHDLVEERRELETLHDDTPEDIHRKRAAWERLQRDGGPLWRERMACHLWTAAFFSELTKEAQDGQRIPTTGDLRRFLQDPNAVDARLRGHAWALGVRNRFFHWPIEFPEVFAPHPRPSDAPSPLVERGSGGEVTGGFDCILSNPPWEMIQLEEQEFFATRDPEIAKAPNKAARERLIQRLAQKEPALLRHFRTELHAADALSKYLRQGPRFALTGRGRINTYAVFAELCRRALGPQGRAGIIVPTGIATDDTTKEFFRDLMATGSLARVIGFENEAFIFPAVHHAFKFCALAAAGRGLAEGEADFVFFCRYFPQVQDQRRHFRLSAADIRLLNPNTGTCPVFRTRADAELTKAIYRRVPVLVNEATGQDPWGVTLRQGLFNMSSDSGLFATAPGPGLVPLYEAKMIWHYDHRYGTYEGATRAQLNAGTLPRLSDEQRQDPACRVRPRYWVSQAEVEQRLRDWPHGWLLGFRDITSSVVERTAIFSLIPRVGVGHKFPLLLTGEGIRPSRVLSLASCCSSFVFDYVARQKVGGTSLGFFILRQLPVLPPSAYTAADLLFIVPRVVELTYTAWDIKAFADDVWRETSPPSPLSTSGEGESSGSETGVRLRQALQQQWEANRSETGGHEWNPPEWAEIAADGCPLPPFKWSDDRRAVLRAELDAWYARLYGLTRKQLRYILDPHGLSERELADILDPWEDPSCSGPHLLPAEPALDFPGETFRVLKEREEKQFGEYRTRRLVLEAWQRQETQWQERR